MSTCPASQLQNAVISNQQLQEDNYDHVLQNFHAHSPSLASYIAKYLGIYVFLNEDRFLTLNQSKYESRKFATVCRLCKSVDIEGLILNFNYRPSIVKQISFCQFPNIKLLDLSCNNITTIYHLQHLSMPRLSILFLQGNLISSLKPLNKMITPALTSLALKANKYKQIPMLQLPPTVINVEVEVEAKMVKNLCKILTLNSLIVIC